MADLSSFLDELRHKLLLSDVIRASVKLTRRGKEYIGLCPFHQEKGASFTVNDEKGFYHCFGCGAHGDHIAFMMKNQGLPFRDALEVLADKAGVSLPRFSSKSDNTVPDQKDLHQEVYAVLEAAACWFEKNLKQPTSTQAQIYLNDRAINEQSIKKFRLGYASERGLKEALSAQGFSIDVMIESGLLIQPEEKGRSPYERFRNRLVFPIQDLKGRVVAFGGRLLGAGEPKYLNSPETSVFHKGKTLYALHHALPTAKDASPFIVVEGYMDVIALHQAGIVTAVAPLGTALSCEQMHLMWRRCGVPILCFDGDAAGYRAAERAASRSLSEIQPNLSLSFCFLPQGEDPDSMLRQGDRETLKNILSHPLPMVDMLWQMLMQSRSLKTPEEKTQARRDIATLTQEVKDPELRHFYRDDLNQRLQVILSSQNRKNYTKQVSLYVMPPAKIKRDNSPLAHKILLATMINHPTLVGDFAEDLVLLENFPKDFDRISQELLEIIADSPDIDRTSLIDRLTKKGFSVQMEGILNVNVYRYARFSHPSASLDEARMGWQNIWERLALGRIETDEKHRSVAEAKSSLDKQSWEKLKFLKMRMLKQKT